MYDRNRERRFTATPARARRSRALCCALLLWPGLALAVPAVPFDEETLDEIDALNEAIHRHYEQLQTTSSQLDARRSEVAARIETIETELATIDEERSRVPRNGAAEPALRLIDEHRIEARSRYLEALAEKHAMDLESIAGFEEHGTAILTNLERLAEALEKSGRLEREDDPEGTRKALHSLQRGTAVALSVLENWGALTREDPRFRALWATSRVLNRNLERLSASKGLVATVDLVRERTFVVRSLIDQARALRAALDHQGLLLQVAAQNQMLRMHFTRLGAINGLELPDLDIDDTMSRILEDIEEEPYEANARGDRDVMAGFDECVMSGVCR